MIKWDDLTWYQKAAFWVFIGISGWFSPEIASLFHFGGVEVVFAALVYHCVPILRQMQAYYAKVKESVAIAYISYQNSLSAKPSVFALQAAFCITAFWFTGSMAFSVFFFMPSMLLDGGVA